MNTPADIVIRVFGGAEAVRKICNLKKANQVRRWRYPRERGGCDGLVPQKHHEPLLRTARELGLELSPFDLTPWARDYIYDGGTRTAGSQNSCNASAAG